MGNPDVSSAMDPALWFSGRVVESGAAFLSHFVLAVVVIVVILVDSITPLHVPFQ